MNSIKIKQLLVARDGLKCSRSGKEVNNLDELMIEHIVPKSSGGTDDLDNLILVSREENTQITNRVIGATAGAAILGASLAGPVGMIVGGLLGALIGKSVDEGEKNG